MVFSYPQKQKVPPHKGTGPYFVVSRGTTLIAFPINTGSGPLNGVNGAMPSCLEAVVGSK